MTFGPKALYLCKLGSFGTTVSHLKTNYLNGNIYYTSNYNLILYEYNTDQRP